MIDRPAASGETLLKAENICKYYPFTSKFLRKEVGNVKAVDDVSLLVHKGETLGLVGESGCGKTTLGKCIVRLQNPTSGKMFLRSENGQMADLMTLDRKESFYARRRIQMIFQDPYASLNPMKNILSAFDEALQIHGFGRREQRLEIASEMMEAVNLSPDYLYRYPHEFSGGQRQRICIAKSLALNPELIVCDEPVSALDVSIQAQIMNLMRRLQQEYHLAYLFIAHDLSVVKYMSDRIAVMYLGKIVETAKSEEIYRHSLHPYTQALISAVPIPKRGVRKERIYLSGDVPSPMDPPTGCRFHPRCRFCFARCTKEEPVLRQIEGQPEHFAACHLL